MDLWKFTQKRVEIEFHDGQIMQGFVRDYSDREDTEKEYDELDFIPDGEQEITVGEEEIKSIKEI